MSLTLILLVAVALADSPAVAPATPVRPVVDILHGQPIEDRYRWLEQRDDPVVVAWAHAQSDYTRSVLGAIAEDVTADTVAPSSPEIAIEAGRYRRPVSYTHLDVYKRQTWHSMQAVASSR